MRDQSLMRFGPAGWSYEDWKGKVYPKPAPRGFHPLTFLARSVDLVEVNATFYAPQSEDSARSWLNRIQDFPRFRFIIKAWHRITHDPTPLSASEWAQWLPVLDPLHQAARLSAVLVQFPFAVHEGPFARHRLLELQSRLPPKTPLAAEFRHLSWLKPETLDFLRTHNITFVNIDQPAGTNQLPPTSIVTAPLAYVRLHGRNSQTWWSAQSNRNTRYDYLYPQPIINHWANRIQTLRTQARETLIVTNNHFHGKAMVAALELAHATTGEKQVIPDPLLSTYPHLESIHRPSPGELF